VSGALPKKLTKAQTHWSETNEAFKVNTRQKKAPPQAEGLILFNLAH